MKITIAYAFVGMLLFGLFFTSCQKSIDNSAADIQALKASVTALQKRSDSLAAALAITNSNIGTLGKSVDSIRVQLTGISYQIGLLTTQLTTVNANVTAINAQISELNQKYIDLLAKLNGILAQLTNTTAYLNARIDSLSASIVRMQKTSDSLKNALATTNNNLSNYSRSVDTIKIQLVFIVTQINQFTIQLNTTNANIPLINAQITLLNQQYADLLAKLNAILVLLNTSPSTLTSGLVAYYPFSGNAGDSSGNRNHGIVNGATLTTDRFGNLNKAYNFDGILNSISFNLNSIGNIIQAKSEFTTSIWVKTNDLNAPLISMQGIGGYEYNFHIGTLADLVQSSGNYGILVRDNCCGTGNNIFGSNVVNNTWYMLTIVRLSNGTLQLYKDGNLEISSPSGQSGILDFSNTGSKMAFGADLSWVNGGPSCNSCNSADQQYLKGALDDIRIYNRALTQSEITYLATH